MRIFVTGATGFVGSEIVSDLLNNGHRVLGLARSDAAADALIAVGAEAHRGDIEDHDSLRSGAARSDGVVHTAFDHDFSRFAHNCEKDRRAIEALGTGLHGTSKPLVITSSTAMGSAAPGERASEDVFNASSPNPRVASELAGRELLGRGIHVVTIRASQIHDSRKQGLVSDVIALARKKGVSCYVGEGANAWSAAHVDDAARLYRLAIERNQAGARYHATAERSIGFRAIAEAIGEHFGLPVRSLGTEAAGDHFGWLGAFVAKDLSADNASTRRRLDWHPHGPTLLEDIRTMAVQARADR